MYFIIISSSSEFLMLSCSRPSISDDEAIRFVDRLFITVSMTFDRQTNSPKMMKPWIELATSEIMKKLVELASKIHDAASIDHVSPISRNSRR